MSSTTGVIVLFQEHWSVEIAGLPALHRILLSGHKAGLKQWHVLVWQGAKQVRASLATSPKLQDIDWYIHVLQDAAPAYLDVILPAEEVIVVAGIAVFDHRLLADLQATEGPTLCVTTTSESMATGVVLQDGQVVATTTAPDPISYATGILRCSGRLLGQVIHQSSQEIQQASTPLSALLPSVIAHTPVQALDVSQHLWMPLAMPLKATVAAAETQLLRRLGRQDESPMVRWLSRSLSRMLTKRLMRTAVTPNHITLCSALIGLIGAYFLAQPFYLWQVLGSLLFLMSTIIDGCDGEIARLTFQESAFGAKFDIIMDNVVHLFLFPGIALGLYRQQHDALYLLLGGLALGGVVVSVAVYVPYRLHQEEFRSAQTRLHDSLASRDFAYILPLLALFQQLHWFLWATTIGTYVFAIAWVIISRRGRRRQRHALS